jgi:hypothetical protein
MDIQPVAEETVAVLKSDLLRIAYFKCDWLVMERGPECHRTITSATGAVVSEDGEPVEVCQIRGSICNSCWAADWAKSILKEAAK